MTAEVVSSRSRTMLRICFAMILATATLARGAGKTITVAADGSGDFKTVQAAVDSVAPGNSDRTMININPGVYKERIVLTKQKPPISFIGVDADQSKTVLTNDWNATFVPL